MSGQLLKMPWQGCQLVLLPCDSPSYCFFLQITGIHTGPWEDTQGWCFRDHYECWRKRSGAGLGVELYPCTLGNLSWGVCFLLQNFYFYYLYNPGQACCRFSLYINIVIILHGKYSTTKMPKSCCSKRLSHKADLIVTAVTANYLFGNASFHPPPSCG